MRIYFTVLIIALLTTVSSAHAQGEDHAANQGAAAEQDAEPAQLITKGLAAIRDFLSSEEAQDPKQIRKFLDEKIAPYFAFDMMTRWIARPIYGQMTPDQQEQLRARVKQMFLATLARQLSSQNDLQPRIDFLPPVRTGPDSMELAARVMPAYGYPRRLGFRFYRTSEGWKIIDASSDGISAVVYYRQRFLDRIHHQGAPPPDRRSSAHQETQ